MKFEQVTRNAREGMKIRRKGWTKDYVWKFEYREYFDDLLLINNNGNTAKICREDLTADDWEIFIENKLDQRIGNINCQAVSAEDIKKCVRKTRRDIKKYCREIGLDESEIDRMIIRNFGPRLS